MRCPKCHYISFDSGDRCRNCGNDLSLPPEVTRPDLPIANANAADGPLSDFALETPPPTQPRAPDTASDLPLFARSSPDRSVAASALSPRAPLAVRRSNPAPVRARSRAADEPTLDLGLLAEPEMRGVERLAFSSGMSSVDETPPAPLLHRTASGLIDATLVTSIQAAVIYLTLRLCGLTLAELRVLPPVPLGAFLLLLAGGYFISFTVAGGQTIGKMATGIRVVPIAERDPGNARVTMGSAVLRAAGCLISVLTAGLGYLPAVVSHDHRALHDRLADTRVVRA